MDNIRELFDNSCFQCPVIMVEENQASPHKGLADSLRTGRADTECNNNLKNAEHFLFIPRTGRSVTVSLDK